MYYILRHLFIKLFRFDMRKFIQVCWTTYLNVVWVFCASTRYNSSCHNCCSVSPLPLEVRLCMSLSSSLFWYSTNYYGLHWWGTPLLWLGHTAILGKLSFKKDITKKLTVGVNCCNPIRKIKEKSTSTITISLKMVSQRP